MKNKLPLLVSLAFCVYGLYLRLLKLSTRELWGDELYLLGALKGSFFDMLKVLPYHEHCLYLNGDHFLLYPFFKLFGYNKWGLVIPHVIATIIGFWFLYKICRRYFKTLIGYLVTFSIVCFNATMIFHATEIKFYAVLPTLCVASFYFADRLVNEYDFLKTKQKVLIGIVFVFVSWFHLYGILMPYLSAAYFLFSKPFDKANFKKVFKFMAIVAVIIAPLWLISVLGGHVKTGVQVWRNTFGPIPNPLEDIIGFLKCIFGNLVGYRMFYIFLLGLFFPFLMWNKDGKRQTALVFIMVFLPIAMLLIINAVNFFYFVQRQFIWVIPIFAFYLGWSWDSFFVFLKRTKNEL